MEMMIDRISDNNILVVHTLQTRLKQYNRQYKVVLENVSSVYWYQEWRDITTIPSQVRDAPLQATYNIIGFQAVFFLRCSDLLITHVDAVIFGWHSSYSVIIDDDRYVVRRP
jgi:hypothetical protein